MPIMPCFNENQAHAEGKIIGSTIEAERMPAMIDGAIGAISIPSSAKVPMIRRSKILDMITSRLGREDQRRLRSRTT